MTNAVHLLSLPEVENMIVDDERQFQVRPEPDQFEPGIGLVFAAAIIAALTIGIFVGYAMR